MPRISDDILLTHLEVALAVAPEHTLVRLNADDPRAQRSARVDLARHLVERMRGFTIEGDSQGGQVAQSCLFPCDLLPIGLTDWPCRGGLLEWPVRGVGAQLNNPLGDSLPCPNACLIACKCESPNLFGDVQRCLVPIGL